MKRIYTLLLFIVLLAVSPVWGQTPHYVVPDTTGLGGTGDGSSFTNAFHGMPATLVRGDTYWVADGTYPPYVFDDAVSAGKKTYVRHANADSCGGVTGWAAGLGDGQALFTGAGTVWTVKTNGWVFDGVSATSDTLGHGIKLYPTAADAKGIQITGPVSGYTDLADSLEFRYIEIIGRGMNSGDTDDDCCIYAVSNDADGCTDVLIDHCYLHDVGWVHILTRRCKDWTIEYTHFARNQNDPGQHSCSTSDAQSNDFTFRYNTWADCEGTGIIEWIGVKDAGYTSDNWLIYGNLFYLSPGNPFDREGTSGGTISGVSYHTETNCWFVNNTIVNMPGVSGARHYAGSDSCYSYNNLYFDSGILGYFTPEDHDYDSYYNMTLQYGTAAGVHDASYAEVDTTLFEDYSGCDFRPARATEPGRADLGATYATDALGVTRGGDGNWERGAFELNADPEEGQAGVHTYYVHKDSTGTGTFTDPFGTIAEAEAAADSNDVVVFRSDLPGQKITFAAPGMTYKSETGSAFVLGGQKSLAGWTIPEAGGETVIDSVKTAADGQFSASAGGNSYITTTTTTLFGRGAAETTLYHGAMTYTVDTALWSTFTNVHLKMRCVLNRTGDVKLKIKIIEGAALANNDTTGFRNYVASAADSLEWNITNPDSLTTYESPDISSLFNNLTIDGDNTVTVLLMDNGTASNNLYFRSRSLDGEIAAHPAPWLVWTYTQTGSSANFAYATGATGVNRAWNGGVAITKVDSMDTLGEDEFFISGDRIYVNAADTTGIACDGWGASAIDVNGQDDATVLRVVVDGTGFSGPLANLSGSRGLLAHSYFYDGLVGVYASGDTNQVINNVFAVADTAKTDTGTGNVFDYNAVVSGGQTFGGAHDIALAAYDPDDPPEEARDKGTIIDGSDYLGAAPEPGPVELDELAITNESLFTIFSNGILTPIFGANVLTPIR